MAREGARYGGVGIGASLINYAAYAAALALVPALPPLAALAFGSVVATTASYLGYSRFVFDR
jgi:putative flippase GtrA